MNSLKETILKRCPDTITKTSSIILIALSAAVYLLALTSEPDLDPDANGYVVLAKSLATGHGYSNIDCVGNPIHTKFPVGFPLFLTPIVAVFGYNFFLLKAAISLCAIAVFLCIAWKKTIFRQANTVAILLLTIGSSWIFRYSHSIMSEIPYLLFSLLALIAAERYHHQKQWLTKNGVLTILLVLMTYLTRTIGISLFAGIIAALFFAKKNDGTVPYKKIMFISLGFCIPLLLLKLMLPEADNGATGSYVQFLFADPYQTATSQMNLSNFGNRLLHNLYGLIFYGLPNNLTGLELKARSLAALLLLVVTVIGFTQSFYKNRSSIEWYLALYVGILIIWPWTRNMGTRFLVGVLPFLFYFFLAGLHHVLSWLPDKKFKVPVFYILITVLFSCNVFATVKYLHQNIQKDWAQKPSGHFVEMASWITRNTPPDAVFLNYSTGALLIWANRKSLLVSEVATIENLKEILRNNSGNYIISEKDYFLSIIKQHPENFLPLYIKNGFTIFRIK